MFWGFVFCFVFVFYLQIFLGNVSVGNSSNGPRQPGPLRDSLQVPAVVAAFAAFGCGQTKESLPHQYWPTFSEREHHGFHASRKGSSLQKAQKQNSMGAAEVGGGPRQEAPTGTGGVTPPQVDPVLQAATRASPPPSSRPRPQTPARAPRDPLAPPTFAFSKPFKAGRRARGGTTEPQLRCFFLSVRPLTPAKKRLPECRGPVPAAGPRPGRPRSRRGLSSRLDTCRAPAPRFRAADSGAPPPGLHREPRRRGDRPRGPFTFLSQSPAAEARGALTPPPASLSHPRRRQESPAAQPTPALTWFKSSLSQDTHRLPGPPPRSRCHRSLAGLRGLGGASEETVCFYWLF